jgi:hypothetical protein
MPLYLQTNKCINLHRNETWTRFDPIRSDSNYPSLFCSLRCEREWVASCLANLSLGDILDIQQHAFAVTGCGSFAASDNGRT